MATFKDKCARDFVIVIQFGLDSDVCCAFTLQQKLRTREENILAKKYLCQEMRVKINLRRDQKRS